MQKNLKNWVYLLLYFLCSFANVVAYFLVKKLNITFVYCNFLYNYYSITVLLAAINLFLFFIGLKEISNPIAQKLINFFATSTFGVYLIHENPSIRPILWNYFSFLTTQPHVFTILLVLIIPIILFIIFTLLDKFRIFVFNIIINIFSRKEKMLHFENLKKLEEKICQK